MDAFEAEILRSVIDSAAHDLGGLSSALAMRADVMQRTTPGQTASALAAIASELRALGGQLREMRGPQGDGTLAPTPSGSLVEWLARIRRFGSPMLGRGFAFKGEVVDVRIEADTTHQLTYVVLALFSFIRSSHGPGKAEIQITSGLDGNTVRIELSVSSLSGSWTVTPDPANEWWNWAAMRAASAGIDLGVSGGQVRLLVPCPQ